MPASAGGEGGLETEREVEGEVVTRPLSYTPDESGRASLGEPPASGAGEAAVSGAGEAAAGVDSLLDLAFAKCDKNGNGRISKRELKTALKADEGLMAMLGLKRMKDVHRFMDKVDADKDGACDVGELRAFFVAAAKPKVAEPEVAS